MSWYREKTEKGTGGSYHYGVKMVLILIGSLTNEDKLILREKLTKIPGVESANLNLNNNKLEVSFDLRQTSVGQIAFQVSQLGYKYVKSG